MDQFVGEKTAAKLLKKGKLVAIPTETVFGLAASAVKAHAVRRVFRTKRRPTNRALIVHYGTKPLWLRDCQWTADAQILADNFWPGPLTMILRRNSQSPICADVSGFGNTIAVRRSASLQMSRLCDRCGPLAAPSANLYQELSTTTDVNAARALRSIAVLHGERCTVGIESTIVDLTTQEYCIRRLGSITREQIARFVPCVVGEELQGCPGSGKHYQPSKPLRLGAIDVQRGEALLCFGPTELRARWMANLSVSGDLDEAARNLYMMLHDLSMTECDGIAVAPIPTVGVGAAVNDKLARAVME